MTHLHGDTKNLLYLELKLCISLGISERMLHIHNNFYYLSSIKQK